MYAISYLSTELRRQIKKLEEKAEFSTDPNEVFGVRMKIEELQRQTKSYLECDIEEAKDLQAQLYDKVEKLARIGKSDSAQQFHYLIRSVEDHVQRLLVERALKEQQRKPTTTKEDIDVRQPRIERLEPAATPSPDKSESKPGRHRWTVGTGAGIQRRD